MLEVDNLGKRYPGADRMALHDVSFAVEQGQIVGLIGKNGAGKTTLLKVLAKAQRPTCGTVRYNRRDLFARPGMLDDFGIMIAPVFYPHLSAIGNLEFYLDVHGKSACRRNIRPMLELVELWDSRDRKPAGFSFGMKQRMALAIALVADPKFMLLDEPFVGLDPDGILELVDVLGRWARERGVTMIVSSHQLKELGSLCDRYLYMENGTLADQFDGKQPEVTVIALRCPIDDPGSLHVRFPDASVPDAQRMHVEIASDSPMIGDVMAWLAEHCGIACVMVKPSRLDACFGKVRG